MHEASEAIEVPAPRDLAKHLAALARVHKRGSQTSIAERIAAGINALTPAEVRRKFDASDVDTETVTGIVLALAEAQDILSTRAALVSEALRRIEVAASDDASMGDDA